VFTGWLAVQFLGLLFGLFFFGDFHGRLAKIFFCWPFLKICLHSIFEAKLSTTLLFSLVPSEALFCAFRFALCRESEAV